MEGRFFFFFLKIYMTIKIIIVSKFNSDLTQIQ
jgi:hypothetical protein